VITATGSDWTLPDYYRERARRTPDLIAFRYWLQDEWQGLTWLECLHRGQLLAGALVAAGLTPGMRLGILAPNDLPWELTQVAALMAGAVVVGLDPQDSAERLDEMLLAAGIGMLAVADSANFLRLPAESRANLRGVICFSDEAAPAGVTQAWWRWSALLASSGAAPVQGLNANAPALIVFTSGSTGHPRGIVYTHAQCAVAVDAILNAFPQIHPDDRLVCWLPLSGLFQRVINFCAVAAGAQSWLLSEPRRLLQILPIARPHWLIGVPRFYEKLAGGLALAGREGSPQQQRLVAWAVDVGTRVAASKRAGQATGACLRCQHWAADWLVLRRLRAVVGGEVRAMLSGSAPCAVAVLEQLQALGLPVLEAYGLSENIVPVALNRMDESRVGTVGRVLAPNELSIAADGEILVRGPGVFHGYLNAASATPAVDAEGFLHTGDLGQLDAQGYLRIAGRKSEIFKTSTGRKIAPVLLESVLQALPGVDHAVVFGAGRKAPVALLTLADPPAENLTNAAAFRQLAERLAAAVPATLAALPGYSHPAGLLVSLTPLTVANQSLTPSLKLRRWALAARYQPPLDRLYAALEARPGERFCEALAPDLLMLGL